MKHKLLLIMLIGALSFSCSKKKKAQKRPVIVTSTKPILKDVPIFIEVPGHVEAYKAVTIEPQVSGLITNIYYQEGQYVEKGDLIVTIDDRPYVADLHKTEAQLAESTASLAYAKDTLQRNTPLAADEYISQDYFDNLNTNVLKLDAEILQNFSMIEEAKIKVDYCYIHAPISGIMGNKKIDVGNLVSQSAGSNLTTINQISPIYGSFYLPEKDLHKVMKARAKSKKPLDVLLDYSDDFKDSYKGSLEFIDNQVDEKTGMILLKAVIANEKKMLWPGQFVNTRVILYTQNNAILVPAEAIKRNAKGFYVYKINSESKVSMQYVSLGQLENNYHIINKGLTTDDEIVLTGQLDLYPGAKVSVKNPGDS